MLSRSSPPSGARSSLVASIVCNVQQQKQRVWSGRERGRHREGAVLPVADTWYLGMLGPRSDQLMPCIHHRPRHTVSAADWAGARAERTTDRDAAFLVPGRGAVSARMGEGGTAKSEEWWDWWCDMWAESEASSCYRDRVLAGEAERRNETEGRGVWDSGIVGLRDRLCVCAEHCVLCSRVDSEWARLSTEVGTELGSAQFETALARSALRTPAISSRPPQPQPAAALVSHDSESRASAPWVMHRRLLGRFHLTAPEPWSRQLRQDIPSPAKRRS
jgi:hypothetical protein